MSTTQAMTTTTIASGPARTLTRRCPCRGRPARQKLSAETAAATRVPQRVEDVPQGGEDDGHTDTGDDPAGAPPHGRQPASRPSPGGHRFPRSVTDGDVSPLDHPFGTFGSGSRIPARPRCRHGPPPPALPSRCSPARAEQRHEREGRVALRGVAHSPAVALDRRSEPSVQHTFSDLFGCRRLPLAASPSTTVGPAITPTSGAAAFHADADPRRHPLSQR
jgi:hypothetical protein